MFSGAAILPQVFLGGGGELVVPFLPEAVDERAAQELIGAQALAAPQHLGAFAYLPAMEIHGREAVVFLETHGI